MDRIMNKADDLAYQQQVLAVEIGNNYDAFYAGLKHGRQTALDVVQSYIDDTTDTSSIPFWSNCIQDIQDLSNPDELVMREVRFLVRIPGSEPIEHRFSVDVTGMTQEEADAMVADTLDAITID